MDSRMDILLNNFSFINNFNNYPDAVIVIDTNNDILQWNKKAVEIFGYKEQEIIGRNIAILFDQESEKIYEALKTGKRCVISSKNSLAENIYVEISCSELLKKQKILITARDVTKNQKVIGKLLVEYEKNSKINLYKNTFITSLSNEFKNPVHTMIGFSQGLMDGICGELNERQLKYVNIMNKNANSLLELINDFLELSRLEKNNFETNIRLLNISNILNRLAEKFKTKAEAKGLQFEIDFLDLTKKNIFTDEDLFCKVIYTIMENAVKFTEIGSIKLKVMHPDLDFIKTQGIEPEENYTDKSYILLSVTDTGIGIPEEEKDSVFDEYSLTERNTAKKYGGTGLKLAIAKKIISRLGGSIWLESSLGQGTTFSFAIPVEKTKLKLNIENLEKIYAE